MTGAAELAAPPQPTMTLRARIGHGGMATIYVGQRVDAQGAEQEVAVKVLHPHLAEDPHIRKMFLHEASLAERMSHENVVGVIDKGEDVEHGTYIVLEYVEGGDLAKVLKAAAQRRKRLPPGVVARLIVDLCRGLHVAHELKADDGAPLNLIHRDVSPHNLLVGVDGVARLIDFGIARSDERYTMTRPGQIKGKLAYMAPEQLAHEKDVDRRIDVFAAGIVLWEALLSRRLFKGEDEVSIINKVLRAEVEPPSRAHDALGPFDAVIDRALARKADERFATAEELAEAVEAAAAELDGGMASRELTASVVQDLLTDFLEERAARIETAQLTPLGRPHPRPIPVPEHSQITSTVPAQRSPLVWVLAALLLVALGAIGAILLWPKDPAPSPSEPQAREPVAAPAEPPSVEVEPAEVEPPAEAIAAPAPEAVETPEETEPAAATPEPPRRRSGRARTRGRRSGASASARETAAATAEQTPAETPVEEPRANSRTLGATPSDDLEVNPYAN